MKPTHIKAEILNVLLWSMNSHCISCRPEPTILSKKIFPFFSASKNIVVPKIEREEIQEKANSSPRDRPFFPLSPILPRSSSLPHLASLLPHSGPSPAQSALLLPSTAPSHSYSAPAPPPSAPVPPSPAASLPRPSPHLPASSHIFTAENSSIKSQIIHNLSVKKRAKNEDGQSQEKAGEFACL